MLKLTKEKKQKNRLFWIVIAISVAIHLVVYAAMPSATKQSRRSYLVSFSLNRIKPPKPPKTSKPKKVEPKPKPKPKLHKQKKHKPPKQNIIPLANTQSKPQEQPQQQAKPVFGLTKTSVVNDTSKSGVAFRVGNTLMKEQEKEITPPDKVKPYSGGSIERKPVPQAKLTKLPRIKKLVKPQYTEEARLNEIEGVVLLRVTIDEKGRVVAVKVLRGLGYGLDEAAVKAIKQTQFEPGYVGKKPVLTTVRLPVRFVLEDW